MPPQRRIARKLHEEHVAIIDLLGRFARALGQLGAAPPPPEDPSWRVLLAQLGTALQYEVTRHFDLEETQLFPRLHGRGEGELAEMLFEEHEAIRPLAATLQPLIGEAQGARLDAAGWRTLKACGLQLAELLGAHAEKEQGALVPLVDEMLDDTTDEELWTLYAM